MCKFGAWSVALRIWKLSAALNLTLRELIKGSLNAW